ncbi:MAG: hypothetical protein ROZ64_15850 [Burkholderiaceae bacterium]|jgi:hypothetical protein|nr:hypothetical protein [Burkholderiaceae bacterium]
MKRPEKTAAPNTNSGESPSTDWPWINAVAGIQPCKSTAPGGFGSRVSKLTYTRWPLIVALLTDPVHESNRLAALLSRWPATVRRHELPDDCRRRFWKSA